jgi:hypothetical protein
MAMLGDDCTQEPDDKPPSPTAEQIVFASQTIGDIPLGTEKAARQQVMDDMLYLGLSVGFDPLTGTSAPPSPVEYFGTDCDTFVTMFDPEYSERSCEGRSNMLKEYITRYRNDRVPNEMLNRKLVLYVSPASDRSSLGETYHTGYDNDDFHNASFMWADRFDSLVLARDPVFRNEDKKIAMRINMQHELGHLFAQLKEMDYNHDQYYYDDVRNLDNRQHNLSYPMRCYMKPFLYPADLQANFRFCRANQARPDTINTCYWRIRRKYNLWYSLPIEN